MSRWRCWLWIAGLALAFPAWAGRTCEPFQPSPQVQAQAAASAMRVLEALEARPAEVVLLARAGTDLSKHGLHYSHLGFVLREHADGPWTVVHLLNYCGSDESALFAEGLFDFFLDDLARQDARLVWLEPALSARLAELLRSPAIHALHQPSYNLISRPGSRRTQNSTSWALELLAAAQGIEGIERVDHAAAQARLRAEGFEADEVRIAYTKRIAGGLLADNLVFTDHPVKTRLSGRYPVVSVRAILRYLGQQQAIAGEREWRDGRERSAPGPA
jgi:hypothetical protein